MLIDGIILYEKDFTLTNFLNSVRKIDYERNFTEKGEELRWK